ncbi:MAG: MBL fold metallo-hydrolase [Bacilli bacterium]|nr:MBL fold metallo-hydrolase [Bacilli bacterium]
MLTFLGKGSCFNTKLTNTSAYYKKDGYLLLIDCGETVFKKIIDTNLLDNITKIDILITHFHSDHIGSLPSLLFYFELIFSIKPTIIYPEKDQMIKFLTLSGNDSNCYLLKTPDEFNEYKIKDIKQVHAKHINTYGYLIHLNNQVIYYSGDAKTIRDDILKMFMNDEINYFYQDVSTHDIPAHLRLEGLVAIIPVEKRSKITCMHFNDEETEAAALKNGFSV